MNDDLKKIIESCHGFPHIALGPHRAQEDSDTVIIRAFIPYAAEVSVRIRKPCEKDIEMAKVHPDGFFEAIVPGIGEHDILDYWFQVTDETRHHFEIRDPYRFEPVALDSDEVSRFLNGEHNSLFNRFGAHPEVRDSCQGVRFSVWAPNALRVSVVGNFNHWDGRCHPMQQICETGIWELFLPDVRHGDFYKFEIKPKSGFVFLKTDPYAFWVEDSSEAAGIVYDLERSHCWQDDTWRQQPVQRVLSIFKIDNDDQRNVSGIHDLSDEELADLKDRGHSHVEIPDLCGSLNAIAAFFSPDPGIGTPALIQSFVDRCHRHGLGVIIDHMPLRFATPPTNLVCFDGGPLYERQDKPEQNEFCFDTVNPAIKSFFLSYVRFWQEIYHIDGFRLPSDCHNFYRHMTPACRDGYAGLEWLVYEPEPTGRLSKEAVKRLFQRRLDNPFSILGPHKKASKKAAVIRAIIPYAEQAYVYFTDEPGVWYQMVQICSEGLWQVAVPHARVVRPYRLYVVDEAGNHHDVLDLYALNTSFISEEDNRLFSEGNHYRIYDVLGAHQQVGAGVDGVNFAVWAPNAAAVNVVGDFNRWCGAGHPMRLHPETGIWELFVPAVDNGERYQFEIYPKNGPSFLKSDPYAFFMQTAPATESVVYRIDNIYNWQDQDWLERRRQTNVWRSPVTIYEVHLGSWMRGPNQRLLNYSEMAERLIPYVKDMGFTHIEILPIAEHPYEPSWGYQVSNFYAPTSRLGKPEELMAFIDLCHQNGIGVLLDWVAGHFPKDAHALAKFDGTHLYEHEDPRKGEHKDWGTLIFNYGRHEAENFLIANALFWLEHYHFDGLRVDAVASMLYLDYSRKDGEWIPNIFGGNENLEAIEFLKHTNFIVHGRFPGVMMIAEESTAWAGVSRPTDSGGLGFGFKWNMGWMHDVLSYLQTPPEYRKYHHNRLAFVFHYAFDENFILSLSHDEVVHLKGSLYTKMPGTEWEKFANLRLLYFLMFTHPGKKLNFMGAEFAQIEEWNESGELQWPLLEYEPHQRLKLFFKTLNTLYRNEPVLYEMDCRPAGFEWIDAANHEQSIIVYSRKARDPRIALIIIINFSAISRLDYRIGVPYPSDCMEILNTNDVEFGGLSVMVSPAATYEIEDVPWHGQEFSIRIDKLPALTAMLLKPAPPVLP
ncbi:MAG: 1,4-alpha-glucan branching protein GlgB [Gammaproteobacteria bacterium]